MPVIINELDVVVEPQPAETITAAAAGSSGPVPTVQDIAQVMRYLAERRERVRAD
jgi:hypothetical protein